MTKEQLEKEAKAECFMLTVNTIGIDQKDVELAYILGRKKSIKQNEELRDYRLKTLLNNETSMSKYALNLEKKLGWYDTQLTKAKEIIKQLLGCLEQDTNDPQTNYYVCKYMDKAEQFLKESE